MLIQTLESFSVPERIHRILLSINIPLKRSGLPLNPAATRIWIDDSWFILIVNRFQLALNICASNDKISVRKRSPQGRLPFRFVYLTHPKGVPVQMGEFFYLRLYRASKSPIRNANSFNNSVIEAITRVIMPITIEIISMSVISAALLSVTPCKQGQIKRKATAH